MIIWDFLLEEGESFPVVIFLNEVFGFCVGEDAGGFAFTGALSPFVRVPNFLTVACHFASDFDAHFCGFVNIQLSAICPPKSADISGKKWRTFGGQASKKPVNH
ncbi:MAG TPA: hypothetical protein VMH27_09665 [Puia sp.]|nr:hypothetical protein [Puia sp.]